MGRRKLINATEAQNLLGLSADEDSLIRHYTLDPADRLECEMRRRPHNKLVFAIQLCVMRHAGRLLGADEEPPLAIVSYVADQIGVSPGYFSVYARRTQTRFEHSRYLTDYLGLRNADREDRRAALLAAIDAAALGDKGLPIASEVLAEFRKRKALLPSQHSIEKIGLAGRAIARRRAEAALISDFSVEKLQSLDNLLKVDPPIGQTRFHWLRSAPDAPGAGNLVAMMERLSFIRTLEIDPRLQGRIHSGRWEQMIQEGDVTPAWLAADFNASRRRATIVAQIIKLGQKLTDDAVTMFIKLIGRLFSQVNNRKKQRHVNTRMETAKALRMFLDTISALQSANNNDENAIETLDRKVGWHRLLQIKPGLEAMVEGNDASPLVLAAEQYANVRKYAGQFLQTFTFHSTRRHDPLLAAIETLKRIYAEGRRVLPERIPIAHLGTGERKQIFGQAKPDRCLYEIATLAALRERLRSADIWV